VRDAVSEVREGGGDGGCVVAPGDLIVLSGSARGMVGFMRLVGSGLRSRCGRGRCWSRRGECALHESVVRQLITSEPECSFSESRRTYVQVCRRPTAALMNLPTWIFIRRLTIILFLMTYSDSQD
jgi:hypothetical protein